MYNNIDGSYGGGLLNSGNLTMVNCAVHSNRMPGMINRPPSMSGGSGGGIMSVRRRGLHSAGMGGGLQAG